MVQSELMNMENMILNQMCINKFWLDISEVVFEWNHDQMGNLWKRKSLYLNPVMKSSDSGVIFFYLLLTEGNSDVPDYMLETVSCYSFPSLVYSNLVCEDCFYYASMESRYCLFSTSSLLIY